MVKEDNIKFLKLAFIIFTPLFVMAIMFLIADPIYDNPDDMRIIAIYSGQLGYPISNDAVFISSILGTIFKNLYSLSPYVPWYSLTLYLLHFISLCMGLKIIISIYTSTRTRLFCIFCFFSLYSLIFYRLSFTSTSLFLWLMTMLYILYLNLEGQKPNINEFILGFFLMIAFLLRPSIDKIVIAFTFPIFASFLMTRVRKRFIYTVLPVLALMILSFFFSEELISGQRYNDDYSNLQSARSRLVDTMAGFPGEKTYDALYAADWTEADYLLALVWYWTHNDEVYSADRIKMFLNHNDVSNFPISLQAFRFYLSQNASYLAIFLAAVFLLIGFKDKEKSSAIDSIKLNQNIPKWLIFVVTLILLAGFLSLAAIRLPPRIAIPIILYFYLLYITISPLINKYFFEKSRLIDPKIKLTVTVIVVLSLTIYNYNQILDYSRAAQAKKVLQNDSITQIQEKYSEDIVFFGVTNDRYLSYAHPLREYNDIAEFKIVPDVWNVGTKLYYDFLNSFNAESSQEFIANAINSKEVIFRFRENRHDNFYESGIFFEKHINDHYGYLFPGRNLRFNIILEQENDDSKLYYFMIIADEI